MLVKELQSLALDFRVLDHEGKEIERSTLGEEDTPETHPTFSAADIGEAIKDEDDFEAAGYVTKDADEEDDINDLMGSYEDDSFEDEFDDNSFIDEN